MTKQFTMRKQYAKDVYDIRDPDNNLHIPNVHGYHDAKGMVITLNEQLAIQDRLFPVEKAAYYAGKQIQIKHQYKDVWIDCIPQWATNRQYRVKPDELKCTQCSKYRDMTHSDVCSSCYENNESPETKQHTLDVLAIKEAAPEQFKPTNTDAAYKSNVSMYYVGLYYGFHQIHNSKPQKYPVEFPMISGYRFITAAPVYLTQEEFDSSKD